MDSSLTTGGTSVPHSQTMNLFYLISCHDYHKSLACNVIDFLNCRDDFSNPEDPYKDEDKPPFWVTGEFLTSPTFTIGETPTGYLVENLKSQDVVFLDSKMLSMVLDHHSACLCLHEGHIKLMEDPQGLILVVWCKMGSFPFYMGFLNEDCVVMDGISSVHRFPDGIGGKIGEMSFPLKHELFDTVILSPATKIGKYVFTTGENHFSFELLGTQYSDRTLQTFKTYIQDFNSLIGIRTNGNVEISGLGVITLDLDDVPPGECRYVIASIRTNALWNEIFPSGQQLSFEYVVYRTE